MYKVAFAFRSSALFRTPVTTVIAVGPKRLLSAKDRQRERRMQFSKAKAVTDGGAAALPEFAHLMRQLYKRAHPDLLRSTSPELAANNDESMQTVNGILSTVKTYNEFPAQIVKTIPFHLRMPDGNLERHDLRIQTAGGDCKRQLTVAFEAFFVVTGILPKRTTTGGGKDAFQWSKEYFPLKPGEYDDDDDEVGAP